MRRNPMVWAAVIPLALVLLPVSGPAVAVPLPVGTIETPTVPSVRGWWDPDGPLVAGAAGTLMGDGTVRPSRRPTRPLPVGAPLGTRLASTTRITAVANDSDAGLIAGASPLFGTGTLWRVGLASGRVESRRLTLGSPYSRLLGLTPSAWVLLLPSRAVRIVPFGRGSTTVFAPAHLGQMLAVGSAGIVWLSWTSAPAGSPFSWSVWLTNPSLSTTTQLSSGAVYDGRAPRVVAVMSQGAVSWLVSERSTGRAIELGYRRGAAATVRASDAILRALDPPENSDLGQYVLRAVVPGSVAMSAYQWGGSPLATWTPGAAILVRRGGPSVDPTAMFVTRVWPSQTPDGSSCFTGVTHPNTETDSTNDAEFWVRWPTRSGGTQIVAPSRPRPAALVGAVGTNGRVLLIHRVSFATLSSASVSVRGIGTTTTTHILTRPGASPAPRVYSISGTRSAILQPYSTSYDAVVLRDGSRTTGRVLVAVGNRTGVSTSGPYTAIATEGIASNSAAVYAPDGRRVAVLPASDELAMDGSRVLYSPWDGSLWVRDLARGAGTDNPRRLAGPCVGVDRPCYEHLWLSGRYAVAQPFYSNYPLVIADLVRRTVRRVPLGSTFVPDALNGRTLVWRNAVTGAVFTVDLSRPWRPVPMSGVRSSGATTLAGHVLGWALPATSPPLIGVPVALRLAPLPRAHDSVGAPRLLGPWSPGGTIASTTGPSWVPQWSFSDRVTSWSLIMRSSSGRVVRVWSGTAPDGKIRGVSWSGRLASGAAVAPGTYLWTLTGTGPYGAPLDTTGARIARGLVRVI